MFSSCLSHYKQKLNMEISNNIFHSFLASKRQKRLPNHGTQRNHLVNRENAKQLEEIQQSPPTTAIAQSQAAATTAVSFQPFSRRLSSDRQLFQEIKSAYERRLYQEFD